MSDNKVTILGILDLIPKPDRIFLLIGTGAKVAINFIDLIALGGIAVLALAISNISPSSPNESVVALPLLGPSVLSVNQIVLISFGVAFLFLLKSILALYLNQIIGFRIARIEAESSVALLKEVMLEVSDTKRISISQLQQSIIHSISTLISSFLTSAITLVSEFSLLLILLIGFLAVSPLATLGIVVYLAIIIAGLNFFVIGRLKREAAIEYDASRSTLQQVRDFYNVREETRLDGTSLDWINRIGLTRLKFSQSTVRVLNLNGAPRYVIETGLIFGIFIFMAIVLQFSSLAEQALVIGVFLTGGLRLVAAMLPLQAALSNYKNSTVVGKDAYEVLLRAKYRSRARQETSRKSRTKEINAKFALEFNSVSFAHNSGGYATSGLTFKLLPKKKYAIVGPSGAGKSTLFSLAMGHIKPDEGYIKLFGEDPVTFIDSKPGRVGYVPQKPHLIEGSFLENLLLSIDVQEMNIEKSKVFEAIKQARLEEVMERLPNGLDTLLSADSGALSGGEIQRLGIARAIVRSPKIIFLDEATSALDAQTEHELSKTINELRQSSTVILIAHRLSTVQDADQIIYLDSGKIKGIGTFESLQTQIPDFAQAVKLMMLKTRQP